MKRVALVVFVGLAVLLAGAAAYVYTLDADDFRAEILAEVERRTGRTATLGAPVELRLSPRPILVLEEFTLSGEGPGAAGALLAVRRIEGEADLLALLRGEVVLRRLEVEGAEVLLQARADGGGNWELAATPGAGGPANGARARLAHARVTDSRIRYRGPDGAVTTLLIGRLELEPAAGGERLGFDLAGRLDGLALTATGEAGRLAHLLWESEPYPIDARATLPGMELRVAGQVARPWSGQGLSLEVALRGPDLAPVSERLRVALPGGLPWSLSARLEGDVAELGVRELVAALGDNRVRGTLRISRAGARPRVAGSLHAERLDLLQLVGASAALGTAGARGRVFSEAPWDLSLLRALDAGLEISGDAVDTPLGLVTRLLARASVADGALALQPFDARLGESQVQGSLHATVPPRGIPELRLDLHARQLDVARLFRRLGLDPVLQGRADLHAALTGRGASAAAVAGSLDGRVRALMGAGRGRLSLMENLVGGMTKLLGDVANSDSGEWAAVNCLAADFALRDGVAHREVLLLDTESMTVVGDGSVDLGHERLDLEITPRPKSPTLNLSLAVDVGGTLLEPTFTVNTASAARRVSSLLGGLLFPPAALAAFADLGSGDETPCPALSTRGAGAAQRAPAAAPRARPANTPRNRPDDDSGLQRSLLD